MHQYIEKLQQFNSTPKYREEMEYMVNKVNPQRMDKIMDYGCGIGTIVKHINEKFDTRCYGYDVQNLRTGNDASNDIVFRSAFHFQMNKVFFMHSIAHVNMITHALAVLHDEIMTRGGEIHVITPNKEYVNACVNENYKPDNTVIRHFTKLELEALFIDNGFEVKEVETFGKRVHSKTERMIQERIYLKAVNR